MKTWGTSCSSPSNSKECKNKSEGGKHSRDSRPTANAALLPSPQVTPNTPYSSWLWILGVDYTPSDLQPYAPVTVQVGV